ncbi:MAG TPA: hypothetical protein DCE52_12200 [Rhodobacteraceae bacterium]|nr:hypothetical protein [Paracoccaceae bacterium]
MGAHTLSPLKTSKINKNWLRIVNNAVDASRSTVVLYKTRFLIIESNLRGLPAVIAAARSSADFTLPDRFGFLGVIFQWLVLRVLSSIDMINTRNQ